MRYFWFVIFVLSVGSVSAQNSARVRELEKQRKAALAEIEMTSQLLDETRQTARNSLNRLNLLSKQILSRKQVISLLNQEIGEIDKQIAASRRNISQLERELENKRQNYGKSVQSIYKRRSSQDKLLFILSADNFAQSLRRMRYLREYADWQKKQASEIIGKQKEIAGKQKELEKTRAEKNALLGAREDESRKLQTEESSQKEEVQQLNQKQKQLQADLKKKKQQADALNRQIEKQIAEEIALCRSRSAGDLEQIALAVNRTLADPYLDTQDTYLRKRLGQAVIDVGTECMQRNTSLFHRFAAGHLGTAYTSGNLDLDTFGAHTHRRCDSGFHGAAERYAALQLAGDVLSHDHGVNLRTLHFEDIDLDLLTGEFLQLLLEFIDLLAALADDDTGAGRRDRDRNKLQRALDDDLRDARLRQTDIQILADLGVFDQFL